MGRVDKPVTARKRLAAGAFVAFGVFVPCSAADATAVAYTYDQFGRIATALYDDGLCIAYAYDPNGNRTTQSNTLNDLDESAVWGAGRWGCFRWTPQ